MQRAFEHELLALAMRRVEARVKPSTWEAFRLTAIENLQGVEAAGKLNMDVSTVFVHKHRVLKIAGRGGEDPEDSTGLRPVKPPCRGEIGIVWFANFD